MPDHTTSNGRYRITIRNAAPRVELRGYIDSIERCRRIASALDGLGVVVASPADPTFDPFDPLFGVPEISAVVHAWSSATEDQRDSSRMAWPDMAAALDALVQVL